MTQALFTAMTGLNAGTEQLTVVSDNVANMNTTAYKTSRVDFQDIWYQTKTTGTNSTVASGGTNPYQVGVGVKCASITKDFSSSSLNTTGRTEDMAIQGEGWFTVVNSDGAVLLTRDGTFSLDEEGYIVTANGCKVLGMDTLTSDTRSDVPMKLPTSIRVNEEPTPVAKFEQKDANDLNNANITGGYFLATVSDGKGGVVKLQVKVSDTDTVDGLKVNGMVGNMATGKVWDEATETWSADQSITNYLTASIVDGKIEFKPSGNYEDITFQSGGSSNFVNQANLAGMPKINGVYSTDTLDVSATIIEADDVSADTTKNIKNFSVGADGLVTVKYEDGSTLSVQATDGGNTYFSYSNPEGIIINDDVQNSGNASLYVDPNVLVKANMQMQFAKVVNNGGLVAEGGNMYSVGVNAGDVIYSASNFNGIGGLATGALESSNVDLAQQFSNMILAQRLVQANSQVFSGANSMLETLVYLGQ